MVVVVGGRVVVEVVITIPGIVGPPPCSRILQLIQVKPIQIGFIVVVGITILGKPISFFAHSYRVKPGHSGFVVVVKTGRGGKVTTVRGTVVTGEVTGEVTIVCKFSISQTIPSRSRSRYIN